VCQLQEELLLQGDVLSPFLFNFALENANIKIQGNENGLELSGTI
jgi:hypothetical protein